MTPNTIWMGPVPDVFKGLPFFSFAGGRSIVWAWVSAWCKKLYNVGSYHGSWPYRNDALADWNDTGITAVSSARHPLAFLLRKAQNHAAANAGASQCPTAA